MRCKNRVREFHLLPDECEPRWECTYCEEQYEAQVVNAEVTIYEDARVAEGFCPNCS
jgi:hypothetical protein